MKNVPLTRREEFTKAALQGLLASGYFTERQMNETGVFLDRNIALIAVAAADATLTALDESKEYIDMPRKQS